MEYLAVAVIVALIGASPLFIARLIGAGIAVSVIFTLALWWIFYANAVGYAGPMFGPVLFTTTMITMLSVAIAGFIASENGRKLSLASAVPPALGVLLLIVIVIYGSEMFNADKYRVLIGEMEERVWTQDIQPKDPQHFRPVSYENAIYVARKAVGELGTVGSQFEIREDSLTLQVISGELCMCSRLISPDSEHGTIRER